MRASLAVCALLVPVLVLGGGVAALASTTDDYKAHRVASAEYDHALADAADVRTSASLSLDHYIAIAAEAKVALATGADLQAVGSDLLDATATAALGPLRDSLTAALPDPGPTLEARPPVVNNSDPAVLTDAAAELTEWSGDLRDEWAGHDATIAEIDDALHRLRTGIMAVAGSVAARGAGVLDASGSASAETRAALSSAIARVGGHIEDGTDPSADLTAYLDAAKAVQDSHAEAIAAAAAGSGSGGVDIASGYVPYMGYQEGSYEWAYWLCHGFPWNLPPGMGPPVPIPADYYPCTVFNPDGSTWVFYY